MNDETKAAENHKLFVTNAVKNGVVWVLENDEGVAIASSNEYEDVGVIPFCSDESFAKDLAKEEWSSYKPVAVELPLFLESYVVQLHNDGILVGTNWQGMFGSEMEPTELAMDLVEELKAQKASVEFVNYASLDEYEAATREAMESVEEDEDAAE